MDAHILEKQRSLSHLYSGDTFLSAAGQWASTLGRHFSSLESREANVLNWGEPQPNVNLALSTLHDGASTKDTHEWVPKFQQLLQRTLEHGQNLHHPRYIGHQVPASVPIAALFDAIGSATNQVMAIYEMGPWATAVERAMIATLGAELGYAPNSFGGLITSGGSLANLTALLTARNVALGENDGVWRTGIHDAAKLAFIVQEDVHYCVTRAAGILGIGTNQIVKVPVDDRRKMRVDLLDETLRSLKSSGRTIVAVTAGACATPIGAFDPLNEVADVCEAHGVWMHVDAAHGGAMLMSDQHRHLLSGIDRADSVVWDAHKMLFVPALCAFAFYKNKEHRFAAFEQNAPYLFDPSNPGIADYDSGVQTLECTKRAAAYGLWGLWSLFGRQVFTDLVDVTMAMTSVLHKKLTDADDFVPLHKPECNIQAFRYVPNYARDWDAQRLGDFQLEIRKRVIQSGKAYIVPIKLNGVGALRATMIHPCTTSPDIDAVMQSIRDAANSS